jgi:hypothetical protein
MPTLRPAGFAALSFALLALGLRTSSWWTIAGGVAAAAAAAWLATDPPDPP